MDNPEYPDVSCASQSCEHCQMTSTLSGGAEEDGGSMRAAVGLPPNSSTPTTASSHNSLLTFCCPVQHNERPSRMVSAESFCSL
eukprot:CAMPEP_0184324126 /NCGR_PEP_ID=MMETSP1049-20130417/133679_1 /TAXON_ID=77928 /ORGANISM="Proteomonas sulcata, Strain CCMP704" /LENGTH=83 /DNA_ID=CAMNT_0026645823 /DNA_START=104 /DNA_END=355 /DNA_ORIENTATION=-